MIILWILLAIVAVIALVVMFILFVKINIAFDVKYINKESSAKLRIYVINPSIGISYDLLEPDEEYNDTQEEEKDNTTDEDISDLDQLLDLFSDEERTFVEALKYLKYRVRKFLRYKAAHFRCRDKIRDKFTFKELDIYVRYGNGDASDTAVSVGVLWGVIYNVIGFISHTAVINKHKENVEADFNSNMLDIRVKGILSTRIVNIIYAEKLIKKQYKKINSKKVPIEE